MKRPAMPQHLQFNLPLPEAPAATLPDQQQRELTRALVEMLVQAARKCVSHPAHGGGNEPEADE
jgi:ABC-type nitrate/sulfonate/bicarbonate transport system substrate-binding protein